MLIDTFRLIEDLGFIAQVRSSTTLYATVNALHILGLATLVGAVLTFDLHASGLWKPERWRDGQDVAIPVAAVGLALAIATGILLFAVRGSHYATMPIFLAKIAILVIGFVNIAICHVLTRRSRAELPTIGIRLGAITSAVVWISALFAGRWIAFAS
jgi:hypothetical protein